MTDGKLSNEYINAYVATLRQRHDNLLHENIDLSVRLSLQTELLKNYEKTVTELQKQINTPVNVPTKKSSAKET